MVVRTAIRCGFRNAWTLYSTARGSGVIQVRLRDIPHPIFIRRAGADRYVFEQIFVDRQYAHPKILTLNPKIILDAGAHIGLATVFFASRFPKAHVVAVEPHPANFRLLQMNTAGYANVTLLQAAVWYRDAHVEIENPDTKSWAFRVRDCTKPHRPIDGVTMQSLLGKIRAEQIDLLKLDVEGAEKEIFGCHDLRWLDRINLMCIELHDDLENGCARAVYAAAAQYHFKKYQSGEIDIIEFQH